MGGTGCREKDRRPVLFVLVDFELSRRLREATVHTIPLTRMMALVEASLPRCVTGLDIVRRLKGMVKMVMERAGEMGVEEGAEKINEQQGYQAKSGNWKAGQRIKNENRQGGKSSGSSTHSAT